MIHRDNGVFFDVGAHIGYWSYVAVSWGMRVAAFETNAAVASVITKTKKRQGLPITVYPTGDNLDAFIEETGLVPDFIKIDVDGNEARVICGARHTLQDYGPGVVVEVRGETMGLLSELEELGYREVTRFGEDSVCVFLEKS
ncbi:MAG: FkbM family methyltransferase [Nanoarchaeota archaeon]|nr:FkbM family methyltransferase [Nanoarchaeota archaeon]